MSHQSLKAVVRWITPLLAMIVVATGSPSQALAKELASEFCEVLHRYNAEKRISDSGLRDRVAGEYGQAGDGDRRRTWNVETTCGDFLVAVPLWADVSPPILSHTGANSFQDSTGSTWDFRIGADGVATDVTMSSADGTVTEMKRLGNPRRYN